MSHSFNSAGKIFHLNVDLNSRIPKYRQIIDSVLEAISKGKLEIGDKLPSINEVSEECWLSRDTVEKAYSHLKKEKIIESVKGKGYYINKNDLSKKRSILFVMNKLSAYKMRVFNAFVKTLGTEAAVDLAIYHCEPSIFVKLMKKQGNYDYVIVMPHFKDANFQHVNGTEEVIKAMNAIAAEKLIILDGNLEQLSERVGRVYQDFTADIYGALSTGIDKIKKYKKIILVYPSKAVYPFPKEILFGFKKFCNEHKFDYEILDEIYENMEFHLKDLFITIEENDLVELVQQVRERHYKFGDEIGIISYNDTPLKALLGITVVSTDFKAMGSRAAQMILDKSPANVKNDFNFIDRNSV